MPVIVAPAETPVLTGGMYATVAEVRGAGADPGLTDAQIVSALGQARERVDLFTGDVFAPTVMTVRSSLAGGLIPLPLRVQSVSAVTYADGYGGAPFSSGGYYVRSSATRGDIDAVQLNGAGFFGGLLDLTIEPYRGRAVADAPVLVTGTFGWATVPDAVRDAAVALALQQVPVVNPSSPGSQVGAAEVNVEGDADLGTAPTVPSLSGPVSASRKSTGSATADALLSGYVRGTVRLS